MRNRTGHEVGGDPFVYSNEDHAAVFSATKILFSRYRDFVAFEDVQQECYLWLFQNYDRALNWREVYDTRHAERTLTKALRNAAERYCRKEKAERTGYSTDDEFFYSIPMCASLLQLYFSPDWMIPNGLQLAPTFGGKPANEGGNLMAMVADVGRAYEALPTPDKELLARVYDGSSIVADAIACEALDWDITYSAADSRIRRVVGRLRVNLGGASPYGKDRE